MCDTRCKVCGLKSDEDHGTSNANEYSINFTGVCVSCGSTLSQAFAGIVNMLREAHGERNERVLANLVNRLSEQGFDTSNFRRSA